MARDLTPRSVSGEILSPERHDMTNEARAQVPYASPAEMLERMGGFLHRWSLRGRAAAATDITLQYDRFIRAYNSMYQAAVQLQQTRVEHARAVNDLRHLDDILREDDRRRQAAYTLAAQRDELTQLQLQQQINDLKRKIAAGQRRDAQETQEADVPPSPAEQLRKATAQRQELRRAVEDLVADIKRSAGAAPLAPELEEDIQRIRDDADRLLLHASNERA